VGHPQSAAVDPAATFRRANAVPRGSARAPLSATALWLIVVGLVTAAWAVGRLKLYTPGDDVGYYLGLAGALMMLALLLYPLRKHVRALERLGALRHWFKLHMFFGIAGPILILFHSNLHLGSLNAAVAFWSMVIVAGSGIVGRFIYTRVHHGLYGRESTLQEQQARLGLANSETKSRLHFAPSVEERLTEFEAYATGQIARPISRALRFVTIGLRAHWAYHRSARDLAHILAQHAAERRWTPDKLRERVNLARATVQGYLDTVQEVAQFRAYERMLSAWHVLHVPLVLMLAVSSVVHVIAVHMY
jgi:hypothetical protein